MCGVRKITNFPPAPNPMSTAFLQAEQLYRLGTFRLKIGRNVANHPLNREIHQGSIARLVEKFKENDEPACQQFPISVLIHPDSHWNIEEAPQE